MSSPLIHSRLYNLFRNLKERTVNMSIMSTSRLVDDDDDDDIIILRLL